MNPQYTGLLYAQPTFLSGAARTLDLGGVFDAYNESLTSEADMLATASDWYAVGSDLRAAIRRFSVAHGTRSAHVRRP
jgi:hypothetical protein